MFSRVKTSSPAHIKTPRGTGSLQSTPPPFRWASLFSKPIVNPVNYKSYTLPIFNLSNQYSINFHLAWLGFFVAFLSWFAFPPLLDEAIRADLKLTRPEIGNSNIVALCATLVLRFVMGPLVDKYGPRRTMAAILVIGAIPSGLAGTVKSAQGLYVIRFFIGILGATFVPCLAWTTCFFDTSIVGTANAFVGGWGNMGGGVTYAVMVALYQALHKGGLTPSQSWRASFAVVPVPVLILTAIATLVFGTDHPAGRWQDRHLLPHPTSSSIDQAVIEHKGNETVLSKEKEKDEKAKGSVEVVGVDDDEELARGSSSLHDDGPPAQAVDEKEVNTAVNEALTVKSALMILKNPLTWLPALAYMTTFGFELAVDSNLAAVYIKAHPHLGQLNAGYLASIFGFLNLWTRPLGGIVADLLYRRFGVKSKVYLTLCCGLGQGVLSIGFGQWLKHTEVPSLAGMVIFVVAIAIFNEMGNGANFALVPHCNAHNNGVMSGLVGAMGNAGGIFFALTWRFHPGSGDAWFISGCIAAGINALLFFWPKPKA